MMRFECLFLVFLFVSSVVKVEGLFIPLLTPDNEVCPSNQIFDSTGLTCTQCSLPNITPFDNRCVCESGHHSKEPVCSNIEMQQGRCSFQCASCSDQLLAVSRDQTSCVPCRDTNNTNNENGNDIIQALFDVSTGECSCPNDSMRLVEIYDNSTDIPAVIRKDCHVCPAGQKVITQDISTAGVNYKHDPYTCRSCPNGMHFDELECVCHDEAHFRVGEVSIGSQSCIELLPTVNSNLYSQIKYRRLIQGNEKGARTFTMDSITQSHYYLKAASLCEYADGRMSEYMDTNTAKNCQILGNLCVLNLYDEDSIPCRQFQLVRNQRSLGFSYHDEENWKQSMPWLYYNADVEDIIRDRSISMKVSLREKIGSVHGMKMKVAKYTINGIFIGMEDVGSQLIPCYSGKSKDQSLSAEGMIDFGKPFRMERTCALDFLLNEQMYFYDLYLVDQGKNCGAGRECLYPVPVLINGNGNQYTRRFFTLDNESGKSASGPKVIRYASKLLLSFSLQQSSNSKIYPPVLRIEYVEREVTDIRKNESMPTSIFQVEYTMDTSRFWNGIKITIGFASAIAALILGFRMFNYLVKQRSPSFAVNQVAIIVHFFMTGLHTVVLVFLPFLTLLCLLWFLIYHAQDEMFLLLPSRNDFDLSQELHFFSSMIWCLFCCQIIYVSYLVYNQCQIDVFLIDWEVSKSADSTISLWRRVMVCNEFNKLQTTRKTSLAASLIFVTVLVPLPNSAAATTSIVGTFALHFILFAIATCIQRFLSFAIFERYIAEPKSQRFLDLCTLANISLFILDEEYHGYYLHCRSPYEFADCSLDAILAQMEKESRGVVGKRGLSVPGQEDCQSFEIFVSDEFQKAFREHYDFSKEILDFKEQHRGLQREEEMNSFLIHFIEQSPTPHQEGLKRVVRTSDIVERILGVAPVDIRSASESSCIFTADEATWARDYIFLKSTFHGIEIELLILDFLTYQISDMIFHKSPASALITFVMHNILKYFRRHFGSRNLAKKSFMDRRFLAA